MPLTDLYKRTKNSVVRVLAVSGQEVVSSGSGSVIDSGRVVLTCAHCIVTGMQMAIADPKTPGRGILGNTIFADPRNDVALIEFSQSIGQPVSFGNSDACEVGNGAFVVGFPMGVTEQTLISAHIASRASGYLRIDASVNHGNSGGPLFDLKGNQVGVVNAKHGSLSEFLAQLKNAKPTATISVGGINPVQAIQALIEEMQKNLNLGIGYAIPIAKLKPLHPIFTNCIP